MKKIIVITGPTGVGKTKLSIELAKKYDAEIINADSIQIYKDLNIGSAKPSIEEQEGIKHHLLDFKSIDKTYSAFNYQKDGRKIIKEIRKRSKNVIIVGGTGLYIKALLYNYNFKEQSSKKDELLYDAIFIGLTTDRKNLYNIINNRVEQMINNGLIEEVKSIYNKNKESKALNTAIGYKEIIKYLNGEISLEEAIELIKKNSRRYAKRQYTWFNNQMKIKWFDVNYKNFNETITKVKNYIDKVNN